MPTANNGSTKDVQPPVVQIQSRNPNPENQRSPVVVPVITTYNALADLGAALISRPYSVWNNLSLPELTQPMTLELADRSITKPIGIAEDVFVNVGKFQFPADFVVVDFEPDPRVPLILGRCFLKTSHALIDVYEGEITLRVGKEAITFNLDQTSKYTADYNHMTVNKIDVIDMACDSFSIKKKNKKKEVPRIFKRDRERQSHSIIEPIVSNTASPTLTPFGDSDFLLFEEADSFLALEDDPTSSEVDPTYQDPEGDILLLEAILNSEPPPLPNQEQYLPGELPPHLEYAFLEGDNKLPVIIAKDLKDEEKAALLKVLKSHKRAIAWKLSDIKGVSPEFCTHKILMEEDYEPSCKVKKGESNRAEGAKGRGAEEWGEEKVLKKVGGKVGDGNIDGSSEGRRSKETILLFPHGFSVIQIQIDPKDQEIQPLLPKRNFRLSFAIPFGYAMLRVTIPTMYDGNLPRYA
ncbi:reverse transcriptase domain-containing protein [Tanacetum coccineum]|uniref:Reverse transcriptase domain-containing protein n=1 Tax=Tanacetum coccineum TaxID=301880 RepID=A0ABQ5BDG8_9ASTR